MLFLHAFDLRIFMLADIGNQPGAMLIAGGELVGLEILGHPKAWAAVAERTLGSYLGSGSGTASKQNAGAAAGKWLERVRHAEVSQHPGLGEGEDLEIEAPELEGTGLSWNGEIVYVAAFGA